MKLAASPPRLQVLTAVQEVELAKQIEAGVLADERLSTSSSLDVEVVRDLRDLVELGNQAYEHMIAANLGLVAKVARTHIGQGLDFEDLMQEGTYGLMLAVEKFDYARGLKFSTMATWWIRYGLTVAVGNTSRTVRVPRHVHAQINRFKKADDRLAGMLARRPTDQELAAELDCPVDRVRSLRDLAKPIISLDNLVVDSPAALSTALASDPHPDPFESLAAQEVRAALHRLWVELTLIEREYLDHWLGLSSGRSKSESWIRRQLHLSKSEVEQIQAILHGLMDRARHDSVLAPSA